MKVGVLPVAQLSSAEADAWRDLAGRASEPNPYFSPAAVLAAAALLPDGAGVGVLRVADGDRWLFALPVVRRAGYGRLPVGALVAWHHPYSFLGTPLADRDRVREAWEEVLDALRYRPEERWLVLPQVAVHGPVAVALHQALEARFVRASTVDLFGRPVLRRRPEPTYVDGRISGRHLKNLRRQRRRLEALLGGPLDLRDHARSPVDVADLTAAVDGVLRMEAAGWKGRAGTAMSCHPRSEAYFRRLCHSSAEQGQLQLWTLGTAERAAAYQVNLLSGDTVFHFKIAYDEELAACSPGLQLELAMVEEFHRDGRLASVDSGVDRDNRVSAQLYPDREPLGTLLVPVRGLGGVAAARAAHGVVLAADRLRPVRRRVGRLLASPERQAP